MQLIGCDIHASLHFTIAVQMGVFDHQTSSDKILSVFINDLAPQTALVIQCKCSFVGK